DSNPRYPCEYAGLANWTFRRWGQTPVSHGQEVRSSPLNGRSHVERKSPDSVLSTADKYNQQHGRTGPAASCPGRRDQGAGPIEVPRRSKEGASGIRVGRCEAGGV